MQKIIIIATLAMAVLFSGRICAFAEEEDVDVCGKAPLILAADINQETIASVIQMAIQPCIAKGIKTGILISSDGGEVPPAIAMYDSVSAFGDRKNLKTIAIGMVSSSAVIVYLSGGEREITSNAYVYLHKMSVQMQGKFTSGEIIDKQNTIDELDETYAKIVAKETKLTIEQVHEFMDKGTLLNAKDAVKYGFAHKIIGEEKKE